MGAAFLPTSAAFAKGCNGVVSQLEWGCAAWDNNNGPQFAHYKKQPTSTPPAAKVSPPPRANPVVRAPTLGNGNGIVSQGGGNLISPGNRNGIVSQGGGN